MEEYGESAHCHEKIEGLWQGGEQSTPQKGELLSHWAECCPSPRPTGKIGNLRLEKLKNCDIKKALRLDLSTLGNCRILFRQGPLSCGRVQLPSHFWTCHNASWCHSAGGPDMTDRWWSLSGAITNRVLKTCKLIALLCFWELLEFKHRKSRVLSCLFHWSCG